MHTVIVESSAKAKAVRQYLGKDYDVVAIGGHLRGLPVNKGAVNPAEEFKLSWQLRTGIQPRLDNIVKSVTKSESVILATSPDREGEARAWHLLEFLKSKNALADKPVQRILFDSVTKQAVLDAIDKPEDMSMTDIDAYCAEVALDRLVTDTITPLVRSKVPGARPINRIQAVTLRLLCERETEIEAAAAGSRCPNRVAMVNRDGAKFAAMLVEIDGKEIGENVIVPGEKVETVNALLESGKFQVVDVKSELEDEYPPQLFNLTTLQQGAASTLKIPAMQSMNVIQSLCDGVDVNGDMVGLIFNSYTGNQVRDEQLISEIHQHIRSKYGEGFVVERKGANESEDDMIVSIQPTVPIRQPKDVYKFLDRNQFRIYQLVWHRTVESEMKPAQIELTTVDIVTKNQNHEIKLRAFGELVQSKGYLESAEQDKSNRSKRTALPDLEPGDTVKLAPSGNRSNSATAVPRYNESTLIGKLDELGIWQPTSHASSFHTLKEAGHLKSEGGNLVPTDKGRILNVFHESFLKELVDYEHNADLEQNIDLIATGDLTMQGVLSDFWTTFSKTAEKVMNMDGSKVIDSLNESLSPLVFPGKDDGTDPQSCPKCGKGRISLKLSRVGAFVGCSNYPDCRYTRQLGHVEERRTGTDTREEVIVLGVDPDSGLEVSVRDGRFGVFAQLGVESNPKRVGLPKGWTMNDITLEMALKLLSLPREIGPHPESGHPIYAGLGRYGPFLLYNSMYVNLDSIDRVFSIDVETAAATISSKGSQRARKWQARNVIYELGEHPEGGMITVHRGRRGPYVSHGKFNANIPLETDPKSVTIEQAVELLRQKPWRPYKRRHSRF